MRLSSPAAMRPTSISMKRFNIICALAVPAALFTLAASAQLPATPTTAATPATATAPIAATATPAPEPSRPHHAEVTFADGQLTVRANDSSLRQILSTLSRITGMQISGGVADQRVFGSYGPGEASTILATLLDGTGVNMFIRENDAHSPTTLILTPRTGTSDSPISPTDDQIGLEAQVPPADPAAMASPQQQQPIQPGQAPRQQQTSQQPLVTGPPVSSGVTNNPLGSPSNSTPTASQIPTTNSVPVDTLPAPTTATQAQQGIVDSPNPPPDGQAAGGPLTPEQIYQKLLAMQKAKAAQQ
jgi:hypothetical protein